MRTELTVMVDIDINKKIYPDITPENVLDNIVIQNSGVIDGFELTTDINGLDNRKDYFLTLANITNKKVIKDKKTEPKVVKLDIVENSSKNLEHKILKTYYLLSPNEEKLSRLKFSVGFSHILDGVPIKGIADIHWFIKKNFQTINFERTEIEW